MSNWASLFAAPIKNFEILWIILPIYLNWIAGDIYQEKKGTSLGNAISNGVVMLWVGIDWARYLTNNFKRFDLYFVMMILVTLLVFIYGILITYLGIKANKLAGKIGRIREVSYFLLMLSPIIYGLVKMSWTIFFTILVGLPIFYFAFELLFRVIPDPKHYEFDSGKEGMNYSQESSSINTFNSTDTSFNSMNMTQNSSMQNNLDIFKNNK